MPVKAVSRQGLGVGEGASWGIYLTIGFSAGRVNRPRPKLTMEIETAMAMAVKGRMRKRRSTPSFATTFFHQCLM